MKMLCLVAALIVFPLSAQAAEPGEWFFSPHASVGANSVQGTYFRLGLDTGLHFTETIHGGVGGYYAFGEQPQYDREIGAGPFAAYVLPLADFALDNGRSGPIFGFGFCI